MEVRVVANIAGADLRSITGSNVHCIEKEAGLRLNLENMSTLTKRLLEIKTKVPIQDNWRIGCLRKFLSEKYEMLAKFQDTEQIQSLIDTLCVS